MLVERRGASDEKLVKTAISCGEIIVTVDKVVEYLAQAYRPSGVIAPGLEAPRIRRTRPYTQPPL